MLTEHETLAGAPRVNVELKALDEAPEESLRTCRDIGARDAGTLFQRDTYFGVAAGRLKLREEEPGAPHLVAYERSDEPGARPSRYRIVPVDDPQALREALEAALGVVAVVEKERRLFLWRGVRIHLDEVKGLGSFVELEAVAAPGSDLVEERALVERLRRALGIGAERLVGRGYADALAGSPAPPEPPERPPSAPAGGGLLHLLRFLRERGMLGPRYLRVWARLLRMRLLTRAGRRVVLDGPAFLAPRVRLEIGRDGRLALGRWTWIGRGTRIRCHEGQVRIGAKTVLGEECTITAYQHVSIGRECMVADRAMLIDFDHHFADPDRTIRLQGIDKHDVRVGDNVWIGYAACLLRGVTVGDNAVIGAGAVVTRDVPPNAVVAGVPARVVRMRPPPGGS